MMDLAELMQHFKDPHNREERCEALREYLGLLKDEVASKTVDLAQSVWEELDVEFGGLAVPDCCPGERGNVMFTWLEGAHYLECEVFGNGEVEFFYKNRETGEVWGFDEREDVLDL